MRLEPLLEPENVLVLASCGDRDEVLRRLADHVEGRMDGLSADRLFEALLEREAQYPTSTPEAVAFPHAMLDEIERTLVIVARIDPPVVFKPDAHPPIRLVFGMFGSAAKPFEHVRLLARLARIVRGEAARVRLFGAADAAALHAALLDEDRSHG